VTSAVKALFLPDTRQKQDATLRLNPRRIILSEPGVTLRQRGGYIRSHPVLISSHSPFSFALSKPSEIPLISLLLFILSTMPRRTIHEETTAVGVEFPDILWNVAQRVFQATQRPEYVVYSENTSASMREYWADVHVYQDQANSGTSLDFAGRTMPTPELAIQFAAWEALACLRRVNPTMGNRRAFRYFPSRSTLGGNTIFSSTEEEQDVAIIHLVKYIAALNNLFIRVADVLALTRRAVAVLHNQFAVRSTTVTTTPLPHSGETPLLGIPISVGPRQTTPLTAEHLGLFNTYTVTTRADRRRRHTNVPQNTPAASEDGSPRTEINLTQPAVLDINQVD